jgi:serine/threonine protein kinase/tetratricopeptide (TPR) repeat protein
MSELKEQLQRTLGDNYTLERELGGGGMSRVFVAEETSLGRKVVVKVLPPDLAAAVNLERFRREIQLAAKLQHPHIVPVLAAGVSEGLPYYTMPFIEGESLRARMAKRGELPVHDAAKILRDVLSALSYAHDHGVVHRDIKPDNILLTGPHAVVADFGVAKALSASTNPGSSLTSLGVALGTPAYMSPEQAAADPNTDHRADLYAVGAVAYEMLTGQQVFSARSPQAMLAAHATETPEPIQKRRATVPPALASLIMRSLEKHAADRPQSAGEMLAELEAAITPSGATTPHTGMMPARKVAASPRSRWMAVGGAALLLLLGFSSWYWYGHRVAAATSPSGSPVAEDSTPSLAVLPFENLGKPDDAYFADGMTEEISSRLGTLSGLRVIGRQSVRGYANSDKPLSQIGKELGVTYVLAGSVRWDRSTPGHSLVRVSPALLRVRDGTQIWSTPYEDEMTGVFKIQSKVAEQVADALQVQLDRREQQALAAKPTTNVDAYDYYLRAQSLLAVEGSGTGFLRVVPLFEKAVELDPQFADAWAGLASAHLQAYWFRGDPTERRLTLAKQAIDRLVALQPDGVSTHNVLGEYYYHGRLDYGRALSEFAKAQALSPNDAQASWLKALVERRQGRWREAAEDSRRAVAVDPRNAQYLIQLSSTLYFMRDYAGAEKVAHGAIAIQPDRLAGYAVLALAQIASGHPDSALATLREASQRVQGEELAYGLTSFPWPVFQDARLLRIVNQTTLPENPDDRLNYLYGRMFTAMYRKDSARRTADADAILALGSRALSGTFSDADVIGMFALAHAAKGEREKALSEVRKLAVMMPVSRDAIRGASALQGLAYLAVYVGDVDLAVNTLRQLLQIPAGQVSTAQLRIDPWFDGIRNDPRFQALLTGR